jgi:hypothetical protein
MLTHITGIDAFDWEDAFPGDAFHQGGAFHWRAVEYQRLDIP